MLEGPEKATRYGGTCCGSGAALSKTTSGPKVTLKPLEVSDVTGKKAPSRRRSIFGRLLLVRVLIRLALSLLADMGDAALDK